MIMKSRIASKRIGISIFLIAVLLIGPVVFAEAGWIGVSNFAGGKLLIWNPSRTDGERVFWEGGKISCYELTGQESGFPLYYVHGYGKAIWYINDAFEQSDEGYHYGGKRHGKIIQRFADGRVIESYWEHGVRIK